MAGAFVAHHGVEGVGPFRVWGSVAGKTAKKYATPSPRNGNVLPLGNHPGNTGGKKGRSGRKPNDFLALCKQSKEDPTLWKEAREKNPVAVLALSAEYTETKPAHKTELTGQLTVKVEYDDD